MMAERIEKDINSGSGVVEKCQNNNSYTGYELFLFMALLLRFPDKSFFNDEFLDGLERLLRNISMDDELVKIKRWRSSCGSIIDDCQIEYTRLFINAVPGVVAPPYASFYLDGDRSLYGKAMEKTLAFYHKYGVDVADSEVEPADIVYMELEFIAYLLKCNELEAADEFISSLFMPWFEKFHLQVKGGTEHPFYSVVVDLICFFLEEEK